MTRLFADLFNPSQTDPDRTAVTIDGRSLTRAELVAAARGFALSLPESSGPIAIQADRSLRTVVAAVGCIAAGVPFVPIAPDAGAAEREHVLTDSGAAYMVGDVVPPTMTTLPVDLAGTTHSADPLPRTPDAETAAILYTSGTTGVPKGVLISRSAIASGVEALADAWQWTAADTVAHGLPLFHAHGLVLGVLGSLHIGSPFVHTGSPTPANYASVSATMFFGVPTIWNRIANDPEAARALRDARLLISGSAPLSVQTFERIRTLTGHALVERYGMTEMLIALSTRADGERRPGWVGVPLSGYTTRLRTEAGEAVPADGKSVGRLEVRGPSLFSGYLGQPSATDDSWTEDGWFITGDLAVVDERGFHRIVGRESVDLIKSGGYRIGAGEVEECLRNVTGVGEAAVVGVPDEDLGQRIVAFVILENPGGDAASTGDLGDQLIAHVADELSWHKRPREIRFVEEFPRTPLGKVQKKLLLEEATSMP
ncbi:fatty acid CoA ligase FadD36 [Saccharopolyspora kobensis]|uniref:Fatty acid CoA ligase FadD36 n=2 Tax=Saccharopolyspora kobensis TaxID=146035 RepID=A0A1H5URY0_9PSEU|nr:acyl-CoA synthetase [Saccharopolyspora kobensis]SEF77730.1 fatty acid CoA ligase FadD36 [Saccharopolyspora kobensis]SFC70257.1 fatty acid CoA ligase FadD36 [Saccharopolyspora kobensis]